MGVLPCCLALFPYDHSLRVLSRLSSQKIVIGRLIKWDECKGRKLHTRTGSLEPPRSNHTHKVITEISLSTVYSRKETSKSYSLLLHFYIIFFVMLCQVSLASVLSVYAKSEKSLLKSQFTELLLPDTLNKLVFFFFNEF